MNAHLEQLVLTATGASTLVNCETIQRLWSGYGQILRCTLREANPGNHVSVIVKHVRWPTSNSHPRGWNTDHSHTRKVRSYQVESVWYERWAEQCDESCRVPRCLALEAQGDETFIVLEDLDAAGFDQRRDHATEADVQAGLHWLANFHATYMHEVPTGLWQTGTYWHLGTRPDELDKLEDLKLKTAAPLIDAKLSASPFQTFVHGDAKLANFCFADDSRVAAVDFQYVGGGCGMKDVAYFISSCLSEVQCERGEEALLNTYFGALEHALAVRRSSVPFKDLEADWRALYPIAWTDFFRFLRGWSPGHWKIHRYSQRLASEVLAQL
ncbi:MAG: phosphotransferase [Gammaproteobacteria bacterium]